jgi:hypothetical protein
MPHPTPLPFELALAPFRVDEATRAGVSRRRLRASDLQAPFRGIRSTSADADLVARCRTLEPAMGQGQYFSHVTAARLWGLPLPASFEADTRLHVSTSAREPTRRGVVGHRVRSARDVRFHHGLLVSAPSDAWCELTAVAVQGHETLSLDELIEAGDRLVGWPRPLATFDELDTAMRRYGRARGIRSLRAARAELRAGSASLRETRLRLLVLRAPAGYPEPEPNGAIGLSTGARTFGDLVFRAYKVILEYDGGQHRTLERQFLRDVDRLNDLARDGWLVIRVHKDTKDAATLGWLDAALRSRGWRP